MPSRSSDTSPRDLGSRGLAMLAATDGNGNHPHIARLSDVASWGRDIADAIHCLCAVHGGGIAYFRAATLHPVPGVADHWLERAATGFAGERTYLATLTAAVGPLPSTPGQAASDNAFAALRHAFEMLATSDRIGCSAGAAIGLLVDWKGFRRILDTAAERLGVAIPVNALPDDAAALTAYAAPEIPAAAHRAIRFGAQQVFAQHRGLLDLIEARVSARDRP